MQKVGQIISKGWKTNVKGWKTNVKGWENQCKRLGKPDKYLAGAKIASWIVTWM